MAEKREADTQTRNFLLESLEHFVNATCLLETINVLKSTRSTCRSVTPDPQKNKTPSGPVSTPYGPLSILKKNAKLYLLHRLDTHTGNCLKHYQGLGSRFHISLRMFCSNIDKTPFFGQDTHFCECLGQPPCPPAAAAAAFPALLPAVLCGRSGL